MPEGGPGPEREPLLLRLAEDDFQLAFLALLTVDAVKPASRWEKPLASHLADALTGLGLLLGRARRRCANGSEVVETLFSPEARRVEQYLARFDGRPIDKRPATRRFEGLLFGYPPCCVEAFVRAPYSPNGLAREDQALLFHWACSGCPETPALLQRYRELRGALLRLS